MLERVAENIAEERPNLIPSGSGAGTVEPPDHDIVNLPQPPRGGSQPVRESARIGGLGEAKKGNSDKPHSKKDEPDGGGQDKRDAEKGDGEEKKGGKESEDPQKDDDEGDGDRGKKQGFWSTLRKHPIAVGVSALILIAGIVAGVLWYMHARHFENTDDAFIDGRTVSISPEVTGTIVSVPVDDNQVVHAGDLLALIDDRDYSASLEQANAQIRQAEAAIAIDRAQIEAQHAQVDQAGKQLVEAQAALNFSGNQNNRAQQLVKQGFGTVQTAQQTGSDLQSKQAGIGVATAARVAAERQIDVINAQIQSAQAQLAQAQAQQKTAVANLSRTQLRATLDSRVTRLTAAVGAMATQAQTLMVLVPLRLWVTANFKETQLADMKVGQPVDIKIDAYSKTYHGRIDSLQAGSGTAFSLLPAQNATGNYVKVVQRVPVKITFDQQPDVEIGPGMSVVPTVTVR